MKKLLLLSLFITGFGFTLNAQITGGSDSRQNPRTEDVKTDYLFKNGFLLDAIVSTGDLTGVAVRIGNRWNFGSNDAFRLGVQALWGRVGYYGGYDTGYFTLAPVNVGVVGTMKFSENMGLEAGLNLGYNLTLNIDGEEFEGFDDYGYAEYSNGQHSGILINPEVKFRYKKFATGLDFAFMPFRGGSTTLIGVSAGFRF